MTTYIKNFSISFTASCEVEADSEEEAEALMEAKEIEVKLNDPDCSVDYEDPIVWDDDMDEN